MANDADTISGIGKAHKIAGDRLQREFLGASDHLDMVTEDDPGTGIDDGPGTPSDWRNCRAISVDVAGYVRLTYRRENDGEERTVAMYLPAGILTPVRNVTRVYNNYAAGSQCTGKIVNSLTGAIERGLRLWR